MKVLGISGYYHDSAAALVNEEGIIAAAQEERFTRKKYDYSFPSNAIKFCLEKAGIGLSALDAIVFFEKPLRKLERVFYTLTKEAPFSFPLFLEATYNWAKEKLWIRERIIDFLGVSREKIFFIPHHLSHAASAYLCSPFEEAAILTVDGVGEWATAAISWGKGSKVELIQELHFPHSLGLLYSTFTTFLGFKVNEENKVMGLAAYGNPRFREEVEKVAKLNEDGSVELNLAYFSFLHSRKRMFSSRLTELFGEPRVADKPWVIKDNTLSPEDQVYADIAASIQSFTEEAMLKMAMEAYRLTGSKNLCLAGGVALNCVANSYLFLKSPFEQIFIQPAAGDAGGALGAALYWLAEEKGKRFLLSHAYLGKSYGEKEILEVLKGLDYSQLEYSEIVKKVAEEISQGKVVAWFQGGFEWGPRALGHRSLLARPDSLKLKDFLNQEVKEREPFRPFAPSVKAEKAGGFFRLSKMKGSYPLKFMLLTVECLEREKFKGALQIDGTARLQAVESENEPLFYSLLEAVEEKTDIPAVLNTSLNGRGEPLISTPQEAVRFFKEKPVDVLVLNNFFLTKNGDKAVFQR